MAQSVSDIKKNYPIPVYNFRVMVDNTVISFTEIAGIQLEYEHVTYRHGLSYLEGEEIQTFNHNKFFTLTCKRGTVLGANPTFLYDWLKKRDLRSIEIDFCDENGAAIVYWKIASAVPTSLKAPSISATSTDVAIDTLELQARGVTFGKV
jgi:phage tail-like protein